MKTARHLLAAALVALTLASPAGAEDKTVPESDFNAYKELAQVKLDAAKESLQKDVAALGTRVDNQDKRIDQQGNRIGDVSIWLTGFSALISVAAFAFGLFGYVSVTKRAKEEAQKEAHKATADWLATRGAELQRRIDDAEQATQIAQQMIATLNAEFADQQEQIRAVAKAEQERLKAEADEAMRLIGERMGKPDSVAAPISPDLLAALERSSAALNQKGESEYTFDDWNRRGYAAYGEGEKAKAAEAWRKAADMPDALAVAAAGALFNAGVALGDTDEAIAAYELIETRFDNDTAPAVREQVAKALVNKGVALGQLGRTDEEIAAYDLVEARYANDTAPTLRESVAYARNSKGFTLLCRAKMDWANVAQRQADLNMATRLFEQAESEHPGKPIVLGNRAYCAHLRGEPVEIVRPLLARALKNGGERLYKLSLGDLASQPVPEDAAYRALLDEVWAEVRGEDPPEAAPVAA
ncbi:MAG: hypothetical protein L6Q69_01100 [Zoogloea sp.]|nr:hypothetical protein [Zoogloea sp.]